MRRFVKISDFFRYDIPCGIKNLIRWFPIIWKDRSWDHRYIYEILRHKLDLQQKHIRKHKNHEGYEETAQKIELCVNLLDRLLDADYNDIAFRFFYKKWGQPEFNWIDKGNGYWQLDIKHPKVLTNEDQLECDKEFKVYSKREAELEKQDLDMLFKTMRKHIQTWWD